MTWSILETLCCFAARWAALNRRTRSSNVSCGTAPSAPLLGNVCDAAFGLLEDGVDFAFACGVLEVKRVASATVRGLLLLLPAAILIHSSSSFSLGNLLSTVRTFVGRKLTNLTVDLGRKGEFRCQSPC
jgi:hypothetical protein